MWLLLIAGLGVAVIALAQHKMTAAATLPVTLSPLSGGGGPGESALAQEVSSGVATASAVGTDIASGNIAGAASSAISGLLSQITQHSERLSDAKNENSAVPAAVEAFDADLANIAAAYSAGKLSASQAAQALEALDANVYAYLHSLVGKPGTAWPAQYNNLSMTDNPAVPGPGVACNSGCTVSCCVYLNDLHPPLAGAFVTLLGGNVAAELPNSTIFIKPVQGGFDLYVGEVYPPPSQYGAYTRAAYWVSFLAPKTTPVSLAASIL